MEIKLGNAVRDTVTGFIGIATARVEYINGCVQYAVTPKVSADGKLPDSVYFDFQRLLVVNAGVAPKRRATGGPQRDAPSANYNG